MKRETLAPWCFGFAIAVTAAVAADLPAAQRASSTASPAAKTWIQAMLDARAVYAEHTAAPTTRPGSFQPFTSPVIAGSGPGMPISIDIRGLRMLRLATMLTAGVGNCHIWGEARLVARDGSVTKLSTLKPISIRVGWGQLLTDKNWQDHPLKIGDRTFAHGIWVHADSEVVYALDRDCEKFEAWIGIDRDRPSGAAQFKVLAGPSDPTPLVVAQLAKDYPIQSRWLGKDLGGREREWVEGWRDSAKDEAIISHALGQVGEFAAKLRPEFEAIRKMNAAPRDPRWLELYARVCRTRDAVEKLNRVTASQLRSALSRRLAQLIDAKTAPDDAAWGKFDALADLSVGNGKPIPAESLRASIETLARVWPNRIGNVEAMLKRAGEFEHELARIVAAVEAGDGPSLHGVDQLQTQLASFRRELLLGLPGMREFVSSWPMVDLPGEWESQYEVLQHDLQARGHFHRVAPETWRKDSLILDSDRDPAEIVLRRTAALLNDLRKNAVSSQLSQFTSRLDELTRAGAQIGIDQIEARYILFAETCRLRRRIAFSNPLLDFDRVLFIKRHRALMDHMCDQFYGMAQRPGGGIYILSNPFSGRAEVRDVLAGSVVANGRLQGKRLAGGSTTRRWNISFDGMGNLHGETTEGGSFLSPDLSYDGKSILFAYVECEGDMLHRHHTDPARGHWAEGRCYHIFKVNVDGSDLRQLTDGTWNDFDPCFLPNGRIAFMSERRGGYLRCGRVCPNYTLYDMAADGSDITALSIHETNEWQPSVTHDGRIIYTRWDYVDRFGCTAHHPWTTMLDGRDSRAVHGNFAPRNARPDMELDIRAIPGSHKFVATAAPHHGQAFGSLVVVDPRVEDDDAMAPVRRITPDVGFPESQGGMEAYGAPWALSEDYYLCVYDAGRAMGKRDSRGGYGIYLVDAFGNKELVYRDPDIACLSPIPLRTRPMPTAAPALAQPARNAPGTGQTAKAEDQEGTIAIVNAYEAKRSWPAGTKITALRVLQVLPMSVPSGAPPHETGLRIATAGDSVVPVRYVLGTVPVESDGSAHFTVPANKEIFFQALDERGLAVQSMRSATYLHGGERLTCAGCHENRHEAPRTPKATPLALQRPPSKLKPDVDGSNPFSYPRLVQPVLDRNCVQCHSQSTPKTINLATQPIEGRWFASYRSLVPKYAFTSYGNGLYTTPGQFGARASKLFAILEKGHYGVKLSPEDLHRLTLWLDCSSMFYGVYEKEGGEKQLKGEIVRPTLE